MSEWYDTANLVAFMRRPAVSPILTAMYRYYDDDRVRAVTYGNEASVEYTYDDARRLTSIQHLNRVGMAMQRLDYAYDSRDLPLTVTEEDLNGLVTTTDFVYDARGRLTIERRSANDGTSYRFDYTYDLGGNRLMKVDGHNSRRTVYHYDIHDPCRYQSNNNRLEYYEVWDELPEPDELVSTTYYYYTARGNVERVVTSYENEPGAFYGIRMAYAANGQALTHAIGETWSGNSCPMQDWEVQYVREFRYDAARQRYLNIEHDPVAYRDGIVNPSNPGQLVLNPLSRTWTDYDGDEPYGDFQIAQTGQLTNLGSFELGTGFADPWTGGGGSGGANSKYYHQDLIGTTRMLSDASGSASSASPTVFTAFGERIAGSVPTNGTRYGYAGEWGYQEHGDFPFLHVGHRYYDPSTGRFIQAIRLESRGE